MSGQQDHYQDHELKLRAVAFVGLLAASLVSFVWQMYEMAIFFSAWGLGLAALTTFRVIRLDRAQRSS